MKIIILFVFILTLSVLAADPAPHLAPSHLTTATAELAKPLIGRVFTSTCTLDKGRYARETLEFSAHGITRFSRRFFQDAACQHPGSQPSIREGQYALEREEEGQLLLTVRHLEGLATEDSTPYFEALIRLDHNQLVFDNGPAPAQPYTAI